METVVSRRTDTAVAMDAVRHTRLDRIPTDQAAQLVRQLLDRQGPELGGVEVARFGSAV